MGNRIRSKYPVNVRGLTSLALTAAFLLLAITGTMLYLSPQGKVAHWVGWRMAGLDKEQWSAIHMVSGFLFIVLSGIHLAFNWGVFRRYLRERKPSSRPGPAAHDDRKPAEGRRPGRELVLVIAATALLVAGTLGEWPPFSYVVDLNDHIRASWEARSAPAPYPHAEASTLAAFARRTGVPLEVLKERLARLGLASPDNQTTLAETAKALGLTPEALFERLDLPAAPGAPAMTRAQTPAGHGTGTNLGRRSLEELCLERGLDLEEALAALDKAGIPARAHDRLKDIATGAQCTPAAIVALIEASRR